MGSFVIALAEGEWLTERTAGWVRTWRQYLRRREEEDLGATLQRHERTRPLGDRSFVDELSRLLARNLLPGKLGRPRKDRSWYGVPLLLHYGLESMASCGGTGNEQAAKA